MANEEREINMKKIKKAQKGTTVDSTKYYTDKFLSLTEKAKRASGKDALKFSDEGMKAYGDLKRQYKKGKPGYDAMGNPIKKKTGGKVSKKKK